MLIYVYTVFLRKEHALGPERLWTFRSNASYNEEISGVDVVAIEVQ
jgi:hypothetical protein